MRKFSTTLRFDIPEETGYSENFILEKQTPIVPHFTEQ
jgi:hypothetical protein